MICNSFNEWLCCAQFTSAIPIHCECEFTHVKKTDRKNGFSRFLNFKYAIEKQFYEFVVAFEERNLSSVNRPLRDLTFTDRWNEVMWLVLCMWTRQTVRRFILYYLFVLTTDQATNKQKSDKNWFGRHGFYSVVTLETVNINKEKSGLPRVREKSGKNKIFSRSGNCQGILKKCQGILAIWLMSGKCQGILSWQLNFSKND